MDKKQKTILFVSIGIIGVLLLMCLAGAGLFVFWRRAQNKSAPAQTKVTSPARNFDITQICDRQINRARPTGENAPSDAPQNAPAGMSDRFQKIQEICADGKVSDSEKAELEELFKDIPRPSGIRRQFMNN